MFRGKAQFLAVGLLSMTLLLVSLIQVQAGTTSPIFQDTLLGVSLASLPQDTRVVQDQYVSPAYGFTVVDGEGRLLARVEWLHEASPTEMNNIALKLRESFPTISMRRSSIAIDGRKAIMLSQFPARLKLLLLSFQQTDVCIGYFITLRAI
ncbi:MAG: hypothetical protein Q9O62_13935 [Ardenticatenia bacterium]|nr:hypothetical protein [Ardenticatenia bacterium]